MSVKFSSGSGTGSGTGSGNGYGGGSGWSQRLDSMRPAREPPSWGAGFVRRQINPVAVGGEILHVEVRALPHLHRLDQRDGRKGVVGR